MRKTLLCLLLALCVGPLARAETLVFTFAGDCTLGNDDAWARDRRAFAQVVAREGYAYPFAGVAALFAQDDLTVVNLEGILQNDATGRSDGRRYNFRGPAAYAEILRLGSVELVGLGNNHTGDFSAAGLRSTQAALDAAGVGWCYDGTAYVYEKNGVRVAFVSYLSDHYDEAAVAAQLAALKGPGGCQAAVLLLHAGKEYSARHNRDQERLARHAIDSGADAVIGHHPHVVQGVEWYKGRAICYSLGNFVFGGNRRILEDHRGALIARVALTFGPGGYEGQRLTLYPAWATGALAYNDYRPCLLAGDAAREVLAQVQRDTPFLLPELREGELGAAIELEGPEGP